MKVQGEGFPVLFLHGYMSSGDSFYYQTKFFLERGFKVIAPDFPGFGRSAPLDCPWSVGDYAEWTANLAKTLGIGSAHIIAHSFGGRVALKLLSQPNTFSKLVIVGGAGLVKPRSPRYMRRVKAYRAVKKFAPRFAERHFGSEEYRALPPVMRQSYKLIVNEDLRGCAALVKNKTLLVYGRRDAVTPASEEGQIFHSLIAGSRLAVEEGGHFLFCDRPEIFNDISYRFLTED